MTSRYPWTGTLVGTALGVVLASCASPPPCPQCTAHEEREALLRDIIRAQGDLLLTLTLPPHEPGDIVVVPPPEPQDNTEDV